MTIVEAAWWITGGVDTHRDVHVAAALDPLGGLLGTESFSTEPAGYKALLAWLRGLRQRHQDRRRGHRFLWGRTGPPPAPGGRRGHRGRPTEPPKTPQQWQVRPSRRRRSSPGRPRWSGERQAQVERRGGRGHSGFSSWPSGRPASARVKALIQMRHLGYSAPEQLRCRLEGPLGALRSVAEGVKLRPTKISDSVTAATKASLSSLAHRIEGLDRELAQLDERIEALLMATVPDLLELFGVGPAQRRPSSWRPATTPSGSTQKRPGRTCAAWLRSPTARARPAAGSRPTTVVTARPNSALWRIVMVRIAHDSDDPALLRAPSQGGQDQARGHPQS